MKTINKSLRQELIAEQLKSLMDSAKGKLHNNAKRRRLKRKIERLLVRTP